MNRDFEKKAKMGLDIIYKHHLYFPKKYITTACSMINISDIHSLTDSDQKFVTEKLFPSIVAFAVAAPNNLVYALYSCPFISNIMPALSFAIVKALYEPDKKEVVQINVSALINTAILIHDHFLDEHETLLEFILERLQEEEYDLPSDKDILSFMDKYDEAIKNPIGSHIKINDDSPVAALMAILYTDSLLDSFKETHAELVNEHKNLLDGAIINNNKILPEHNKNFRTLVAQFKHSLEYFYDLNINLRPGPFNIARITYNPFLYDTVILTPALDVIMTPLKSDNFFNSIAAGCYTSFTYRTSYSDNDYSDPLDDYSYTSDQDTINRYFIDNEDSEIFDVVEISSVCHKTIRHNLKNPYICCQAAKKYIDELAVKQDLNLYLIMAQYEQQNILYFKGTELDSIISREPVLSDMAILTNASLSNGYLLMPNICKLTHLLSKKDFTNPLVLAYFNSLIYAMPLFDSDTEKYNESTNYYLKVIDIINTMFTQNDNMLDGNKYIAYIPKESYEYSDVSEIESNITKRVAIHLSRCEDKDMPLTISYLNNYCFFFDDEEFYNNYTFHVSSALFNLAFNEDYPNIFIGYLGREISQNACDKLRDAVRMLTIKLIKSCNVPTIKERHDNLIRLYNDFGNIKNNHN